jgi:hypothetical protein
MDEAGDRKDGFTVVAGWVSSTAQWEQFEWDWRIVLAKYDVPYLHMKLYSQSKGPFSKWAGKANDGTRRRFMEDMISIIKDHTDHWLACYSNDELFNQIDRRFNLRENIQTTYALAGRACVAQVDLWARSQVPRKDVGYVFEDGAGRAGLTKALNIATTLPSARFEPSRNLRTADGSTRKGIIQLQAADLLAYELRKHRCELGKRSGRAVRRSLYSVIDMMPKIVMDSVNIINVVDLCRLESLVSRQPNAPS